MIVKTRRPGRFYILLFTFMIGFLFSCTTKPKKIFPLKIVISKKLGNLKTDKFPSDIIELCLPIENCTDYNLFPKVTLHRLGFAESYDQHLDIKIEGGFAGNKNNINFVKRKIINYLSQKQIGDIFSRTEQSALDVAVQIKSYVQSRPAKTSILILSESGFETAKYDGLHIFSTIDSLKGFMADELCQSKSSSFILFYKPGPFTYHEPAVNNLEMDQRLKEIERENVKAKNEKDLYKREEILEDVANKIRQEMNEEDYRFWYELMKNRIYGKKHTEAFELLKKAAEVAIENNQAKYLLDRIEGEKNTDLWKLSHGHPDHWNPIIEALKREDKEILHQIAQKSEHSHH